MPSEQRTRSIELRPGTVVRIMWNGVCVSEIHPGTKRSFIEMALSPGVEIKTDSVDKASSVNVD